MEWLAILGCISTMERKETKKEEGENWHQPNIRLVVRYAVYWGKSPRLKVHIDSIEPGVDRNVSNGQMPSTNSSGSRPRVVVAVGGCLNTPHVGTEVKNLKFHTLAQVRWKIKAGVVRMSMGVVQITWDKVHQLIPAGPLKCKAGTMT